jgi:hypothetical protein
MRVWSLIIAFLSAGGLSEALAQSAGGPNPGTWIDPPPLATPPADAAPQKTAPASPEPAPAPRAGAPVQKPRRTAEPPPKTSPVLPPDVAERQAPERSGAAGRVKAAEALVTEYLNTWSAPNELALDNTTGFYAPRVRFHGRVMSAREILEEKRRFVRRWPERSYRPRLSTMGTVCAPRGTTCTVRSVFDFTAADPASGRRSQGIGTLELVVSFAGDPPVIAAENSFVLGRARGERRTSLEGGGP